MREVFLYLTGDKVESIHYNPYNKDFGIVGKVDNLELYGIFYKGEIPESDLIHGKETIMKYDFAKKEIYYIYEDRPLTSKEELHELRKLNSMMLLKLTEAGLL